ncbi:MFS transporter [Stappia sp.]|uniref:MFS transporter n=1 Tax=Stappia sp. TaxID=1870903 RepID=UPI003A9A43FA
MVFVPTRHNESALAAAFAPLRYPVFRVLWLAAILAAMGSWAQAVGAAWLMLELTERTDLVAFVQAAASAPVLLLSFLAGTLADLYERRLMQIRAQFWVIAGAACLAALCLAGAATPPFVLLLTFVAGTGAALRAPAWQASIRDIVPDRDVAAAVTLSSIGFNFARIVGPAIGGLIVALADPTGAFAFNVVVSMVFLLALWRISYETPTLSPDRKNNIRSALRTGVEYVITNRQMRLILPRAAAAGIPASAILALLPILVSQRFAGKAEIYGLFLCFFGVGAVASTFVLVHWRKRYTPEALLSGASLLLAGSFLCLATSTSIPVTLLSLLVGGFSWVIVFTTFNTAVQFCSDREYRGRALSAYMTCAFGGLMVGSLIWGSLTEHFSLGVAFSAAGLMLACSVLMRLSGRLPDNKTD